MGGVMIHRVGAGAYDSLRDLFGGGETGDYWIFDPDNTSANVDNDTMSTATGTINALVLTAAGTTPTLQDVSGKWACNTPGSGGSRMTHAIGSTVTQPGTIIVALGNSDTNTHVMVTGSSTTLRWQISNSSAGDVIAFAGSTLDSTINENFGTKVFAVEFNGTSSKFRVDGTQTAAATTGTQSTNQITIGALYDGTFPGQINFYALLFINRILTAGELDRAERALGAHAGLTW